jgi:WD40 repeat protein
MSETGIPLRNRPAPQIWQVMAPRPDSFQCLAWSPDGTLIASGADNRTVRLWEARSGQLVRTLEGHTHSVQSVAWAPDGQHLASGADDNTVRLWDSMTGEELQVYESTYPTHVTLIVSFQAAPKTVDVLGKTKLGDPDIVIHMLPWDASARAATSASLRYVSAKIVLVGESNVGKSCLALRLAQNRYEEQGTTHGMRL